MSLLTDCQFVTGIFLLIITLADGAFFGIKSVEDLAEFDLCPQGVALNKKRFCYFLYQILVMAGYSKSATIHDIYRALGQKIKGKAITLIYLRKLVGTYPEYYQVYCLLINTVSDVLGEEKEIYYIEYFQEAILGCPKLVTMQDRIEQLLADKASSAVINFERQEYRKALITQWVRERRDWRIVSREKADLEYLESNPCSRALALIMPELGCIAEMLSSAEPLFFNKKLLFARYLLTQCRSLTDNGRCPVDGYQADVQK
ncbi:hypothetical protein BJX70DRAFT_391599 [Aspergillus crustosus]